MKEDLEICLENTRCSITEIRENVFRITLIDENDIADIFDLKKYLEESLFHCSLVRYDTLEVRE